jgi:4-amino-4-deoxy-L-arabinose transferase-like glycosyltransferase
MRDIWENRRLLLLILAAVYLISRLFLLDAVPFVKDEGLYSVMIEEQIENATSVVTLFDYPVAWKPPLFFWTSGFFIQYLRGLDFLSIEAVYRLPNTLFGLINVFLVFFILEKLLKERDEAFLATLLYATFFVAVHTDSRVLTDTLCGTTLLLAVWFYLNGLKNRGYFLLGGAFTFITYFVKQTNAALIPVVALVYLFEKDKRKLFDPIFLLSLLAFPLASYLLASMSWGASTGALEHNLLENSILNKLNIESLMSSLIPFFIAMSAWLSISFFGLWKNWNRSLTLSVWFLLIAFPFIAGGWMLWYFYPVLLPIAYFSLQLLVRDKDGKKIKDKFFYGVFFVLILMVFSLGLWNHLDLNKTFGHEKHAGQFLAGKENVLIIGTYAPSIPSYKMLEEKRANGSWLDFGWIILNNRSGEQYYPFINDYYSNHTEVMDGNFAGLFAIKSIFRKDTNISSFDYMAIVGNESVNPGGELVFNESNTTIYKLR